MTPSLQFSPTTYIPPALADWLEEEALSIPIAPAPYWKTDAATLYHGEATAILRGLPTGSVNCAITSPPYWALRNYEAENQIGLEPTPEAFMARLVDVFIELHRVLRETGTVWLVMGDTYASGLIIETGRRDVDRLGICGKSAKKRWGGLCSQHAVNPGRSSKNLLLIPQRLILTLQDTGLFCLRSEIIWEKPNCMPDSVKDRPTRSHEQVFLLTKSARYFFNPDPLREDCLTGNGKAQGVIKGKRFGGRAQATTPVSGFGSRMLFNHPKGRNGRTVWRINVEQFHGNHPAPFPRELVRRCLLAGCPEGGTVLDPFVGSGTVPAVATKCGFRAIGIDINAQYLDLAKERIGKEQRNLNDTIPAVTKQIFHDNAQTDRHPAQPGSHLPTSAPSMEETVPESLNDPLYN